MKFSTTFVLIFLFIWISSGQGQLTPTLRDRSYCGTPERQLTAETLSKLFMQTAGLTEPDRHYLPKRYEIGESAQFYTYNFVDEKYQQITATLRSSADHINIWVEDTEWNNFHVILGDVQGILNGLLFTTPASSINPDSGITFIIHQYFGTPPDFDDDGITDFLITDIKDGWKENEPFIAGYFNPIDQYENGTSVGGSLIAGSNERDLLYIDSYPGIFTDTSHQFEQVLATVAHEYQHLIHYNYDRAEETWVNEGLSELSSFLCGYGLRNPSAYLLDCSIDLTGWDNTITNALKHYAKTALWTYYLYEKSGSDLTREITQSVLPGVEGVSSALMRQGIMISFSDLLIHFFITIIMNDGSLNNLHGFTLGQLEDLRAVPQKTVVEYPYDISVQQKPYSLQLYSLENGDSLYVQFFALPAATDRYIQKTAKDSEYSLEEITGTDYQDFEFGSRWLKEKLMIINTSNNNSILAFNILAAEKYYVTSLAYSTATEADLNIVTTGNICANQFVAPYDSCILRSVSFNSVQSRGRVRLHIYLDPLQDAGNPLDTVSEYSNILENEWVTLDLENFQIMRNQNETFDLGVEFVDYGVLGYSKDPSNLNRSYLRRENDNTFSLLSDFKANNEILNGIWMIRMEYAAPLNYKPEPPDDSKIPFTINLIGPTPFPTPGNPAMRVQYTISKPGRVKIEVFNVLGQKIRTVFDGYDQGPIGVRWWDGTNMNQKPVASGQYFLCFAYNERSEIRKIVLLR